MIYPKNFNPGNAKNQFVILNKNPGHLRLAKSSLQIITARWRLPRVWAWGLGLGLAAMLWWLAGSPAVLAHESREVAGGKYQLRIGFVDEPAYQGLVNAVYLAVCKGRCTSNPDGTFSNGVIGAFETLKVEVFIGGKSQQLAAVPVPRTPGRYNAQFIPTRVGDYTFRVFGTIEGDQIDEKFVPGPSTFDSVESITAIQFPDKPGFGAAPSAATAGAGAGAAPAESSNQPGGPATAGSGAGSGATSGTTAGPVTTSAITPVASNPNSTPASSANTAEQILIDLRQQLTKQQQQLDNARSAANTANALALAGMMAGGAGILLALVALFLGGRRHRASGSSRPRRGAEGG